MKGHTRRKALNDTQDTTVLAGVGYDIETGESFLIIEADRRIGADYVIELRARSFSGADPRDTTFAFARDDYVQLRFSRFF